MDENRVVEGRSLRGVVRGNYDVPLKNDNITVRVVKNPNNKNSRSP